ncbi:HET-domain-containing protein, partial [Periconia macrospinosa]
SNPRIIEPEDTVGYYIALSYRWSAVSEQFSSTRDNISDLKRFLPLWLLPKTIQDAVVFCRELGYRYLWVDCLCIIQDDGDDWKEAVNKMASIFENSHLTISALQSKDSNAGLFHYRKYQDLSSSICLRLRNGQLLTLRLNNGQAELRHDISNSPMRNRGWIFQEKLLSPANIHFGKHALHWECRTCTISEAFTNFEIPAESILKNIMSEIQRPGCSLYPNGHFIVWYMLMMDYSSKLLTFETDRLPAIRGLANRFRKMFSTTFVAGLWLEDLHRGLLWN